MASVEDAFDSVRDTFGIESLNLHQKEAITVIIEELYRRTLLEACSTRDKLIALSS